MDGGAWRAAVHGVVKNRTRLSDFTFTFHFHALEKEMATHSSVLASSVLQDGGTWWAAIYGITQSRTRLKQLSGSSSRLYRTRLLCPWNSPGKNTGVGSHALLQGSSQPRDQTQVFPTNDNAPNAIWTEESPLLCPSLADSIKILYLLTQFISVSRLCL